MNVCSSTLLGCNNVNFSKVLQFTLKLMRRRKTSFNCSDLGNYRWCFSSVRFCSLLGLSLHWFMRKWEFCSFCLSSGSPASDWGCRVGKEWAWRPWGAAAGEGALQKLQSVLCPYSSPPLSVSLRVFSSCAAMWKYSIYFGPLRRSCCYERMKKFAFWAFDVKGLPSRVVGKPLGAGRVGLCLGRAEGRELVLEKKFWLRNTKICL